MHRTYELNSSANVYLAFIDRTVLYEYTIFYIVILLTNADEDSALNETHTSNKRKMQTISLLTPKIQCNCFH